MPNVIDLHVSACFIVKPSSSSIYICGKYEIPVVALPRFSAVWINDQPLIPDDGGYLFEQRLHEVGVQTVEPDPQHLVTVHHALHRRTHGLPVTRVHPILHQETMYVLINSNPAISEKNDFFLENI